MLLSPFTNNIERAYSIIHNECDAENECRILLDSLEPIGLPGYFFYSESYGKRFNDWKQKYGEGRHYWNHYYKELELIDACPHVFHYAFGTDDPRFLYRWKREALRMPVPTTLCIEALVNAGYHDHSRVKRAVNTLIAFKDNPYEKDYGCSCPTAKAELYYKDNDQTPDFENIKKMPIQNVKYFYAPLVRRALMKYPGFQGSAFDLDTRDKTL